jgi:Glutathione S-transferase, N-terminal domain
MSFVKRTMSAVKRKPKAKAGKGDRPEKAKASADKGDRAAKLVLYRCPTPTNVLCPCGAVARRIGKLELEYRTERVPYRRASRPEIVELTHQRRVPVLVDGEEIVHDSKRILQYLDWKYGEDGD